MFITAKRHEREKQELSVRNRLSDAVLKNTEQGLLLLDAKEKVIPPVSQSSIRLFRRQDFANVSFEKLLAPIVTAKTLTAVRKHLAALRAATPLHADTEAADPLADVEVRLPKPDGTYDNGHYSFKFDPIVVPDEPRIWLVRVSDITAHVQVTRELADLRAEVQTQGEILRSVLLMGGAPFGVFLQKTDAAMTAIAAVLKKSAREEQAFRDKLAETLHEVDRIRREAAAFKLSALENAARLFEDSLHDLRGRSTLSGSDFLPLALKVDQLYEQLALVKSLSSAAGPVQGTELAAKGPRLTDNGTQIIEAPKFIAEPSDDTKTSPAPRRAAAAGSLDRTLQALTDHVAEEFDRQVTLDSAGLNLVPPNYQSVIKNVAIQLIRNAVMHGIEPTAVRTAAGKPARGALHLEFRQREENYELLFEDDGCGLIADEVRATAVARGVVTAEQAARMRDREAIKLIFKSRYTTLGKPGAAGTHGAGMSLVRRFVHEAGGKIALASLPGHETRFKISLPVAPASPAAVPAAGTERVA